MMGTYLSRYVCRPSRRSASDPALDLEVAIGGTRSIPTRCCEHWRWYAVFSYRSPAPAVSHAAPGVP